MRYLLLLLLSTIFICMASKTAQAHILKASGSVEAVMHVTPEDDPIAGKQSDFFFYFS